MYMSRIRIRPDIGRQSNLKRLIASNAYGVHQLLYDLFPNRKSRFLYREEVAQEQLGPGSRFRGEPLYYIQSAVAPKPDTPLFDVETKPYDPYIRKGDHFSFRLRANPVVTRKDDNGAAKRHDVMIDGQWALLREICAVGDIVCKGKKREVRQRILNRCGESVAARLVDIVSKGPFSDRLNGRQTSADMLEWALKTKSDQRARRWLSERGLHRLGFRIRTDSGDRQRLQAVACQRHSLPAKGDFAFFVSIDYSGELIVEEPEAFRNALMQGIGPAKAFGCGLMMIKRSRDKRQP